MKRALVFGATGQLGCYSALALKNVGFDVVAVGRRISDNNFFKDYGIEYIGDFFLEDKGCYKKLPNSIDVVVNMAGTMPAHADLNMTPYAQSIVLGTVNICEWMEKINCKRIIFNTTPSDVVDYWGSATPIDDDAIRSFPKDGNDHAVYAICKRAACDILEHMSYVHDIKQTVFRYFIVYGWHPDSHYFLNGVKKELPWRTIIRKSINGKSIEVYGNLNRKKELLYIKDFADAVVHAAKNEICGMFNLGGYKPYSLDEMVDGIINAFSLSTINKIARPDMPDTPQILLSKKKTAEVFGWKPKWTWEDACLDMREECIKMPMKKLWGVNQNADKYK